MSGRRLNSSLQRLIISMVYLVLTAAGAMWLGGAGAAVAALTLYK
ncbi:Uncharacterised protein [Chlamydia abortus]|jgi:hypothetical protein|uniref:Uncharacterized protein n=1 Tax=Paenibacillus residui TaxID=629724 RepID=A0ABW3D725_9BACL|nr:hypothetical protein [Paenibacillus sp. 32O-W]SHE14953.1 Uncharacterised protein [Chlamydia abortus]